MATVFHGWGFPAHQNIYLGSTSVARCRVSVLHCRTRFPLAQVDPPATGHGRPDVFSMIPSEFPDVRSESYVQGYRRVNFEWGGDLNAPRRTWRGFIIRVLLIFLTPFFLVGLFTLMPWCTGPPEWFFHLALPGFHFRHKSGDNLGVL